MISLGWNNLENVERIHSFLAVSALVMFALLVLFEFLAHRQTKREHLFKNLALITFALAILFEVIAYPYSRRVEKLFDDKIAKLSPPPIDVKLRAFFDDADPSILPRVNNGETHFAITFDAPYAAILDSLRADPDAEKYLQAKEDGQAVGAERAIAYVLDINPRIVKFDCDTNKIRTISQKNRDAFAKGLENAPKGKVIIICTSSDFETRNYAEQIRKMLWNAGYTEGKMNKIYTPKGAYSTKSKSVNLLVNDESMPLKFAVAIQFGLYGIGIEAPVSTPDKWPDWLTSDYLTVMVSTNR